MKELEQVLSSPENRLVAYDVSLQLLKDMAPEEAPISQVFIDPILDMVADGEIEAVESFDQAGGFGSTDLMVLVIVPAVVSALSAVLAQTGFKTIAQFRQKRSPNTQLVIRIQDDIEAVIKMVKPKGKQRDINRLAKEVNDAILKYLATAESGAETTKEGYSQEELAQLRQKILDHFDMSAIRDLCFDIKIDFESLSGESKQDKVRELILYCTRKGCISELIKACRQANAHAF